MKPESISRNQLTIIHFNDVYDIEPNAYGQFGFVNFYDAFLQLKKQYPDSLVVFSGDAFAPSKLSKVRKGWQMVHCLKMLNIDVACYGNHQFDYLLPHTMQLAKACQFPWLLSNVKNKETKRNLGEGLSYLILEKTGFKIGFMGLAGPDFKGRLISYYKDIVQYEDCVEKATKLCQQLKKQGCNLIIAITHMRIPADENLAKRVPGIDLILGGHDHVVFSKMVNKIPILKSGDNFQHIGLYKVTQNYKRIKQSQQVVQQGRRWTFQIKCIPIKNAKKEYKQIQNFVKQVVNEYKDRGIAKPTRKKDLAPQIPKSTWKFAYQKMNGHIVLNVYSKQKSEIAFAKYVCFEKKMFLGKIQQNEIYDISNKNIVVESIKSICHQLKSANNESKPAYYGQAQSFIPYLVQCTNTVYLPNEISCTVTQLSQLLQILNYTSETTPTYAIIDICQQYKHKPKQKTYTINPTIRFMRMPKEYQSIVEAKKFSYLYSDLFEKQYERVCVGKGEEGDCEKGRMKERGVYLKIWGDDGLCYYVSYFDCLKMKENTQKDQGKEKQIQNSKMKMFKNSQKALKLIHQSICDFDLQPSDISTYINTATTTPYSPTPSTPPHPKIQLPSFQHLQHINTYIAYSLSKQCRRLNLDKDEGQLYRGIVYNENGISYPRYEIGYGYLPVLFQVRDEWVNSQCWVFGVVDEKLLGMRSWFNVESQGGLHAVYQYMKKIKGRKDTTIIRNDKTCKTAEWVTKYAKKSYDNINFGKFQYFLECLQNVPNVKSTKIQE